MRKSRREEGVGREEGGGEERGGEAEGGRRREGGGVTTVSVVGMIAGCGGVVR